MTWQMASSSSSSWAMQSQAMLASPLQAGTRPVAAAVAVAAAAVRQAAVGPSGAAGGATPPATLCSCATASARCTGCPTAAPLPALRSSSSSSPCSMLPVCPCLHLCSPLRQEAQGSSTTSSRWPLPRQPCLCRPLQQRPTAGAAALAAQRTTQQPRRSWLWPQRAAGRPAAGLAELVLAAAGLPWQDNSGGWLLLW